MKEPTFLIQDIFIQLFLFPPPAVFVIPCIFANSEVQEELDQDLISKCKQTCNVALAKLNAFEE